MILSQCIIHPIDVSDSDKKSDIRFMHDKGNEEVTVIAIGESGIVPTICIFIEESFVIFHYVVLERIERL